MNLCILIPAKNEEGSISETVSRIYEVLDGNCLFNVLVINDYSDDSTETVLAILSSTYLNFTYSNNRSKPGVGSAIKYGLDIWQGDVVAICMADGSDDPIDVFQSLELLLSKDLDCVFGSRFIQGGKVRNYPIIKLILNRLFNNSVRLISRIQYNDFTNIFKMYKRSALISIGKIDANGFSIGLEMSMKAFRNNLNVGIIPINWSQRKTGKSKLNIIRNIRLYFGTLYMCLKR